MAQMEQVIRQTRRELTEAQGRALRAEGGLEVARTARAEELEEAHRQAAAEGEKVREVQGQLDLAKAVVNARDLRIDAYTLEVKAASMRATQAEEALRRAEATTREAEARATRADEAVQQADARAAAAEAASREAEARRAADLADFRKSQGFADELAEFSAGAYLLGFSDAKEKVRRVFGLEGLNDLEPDDEPEEPEAPAEASGQAEEGPIPTEPRSAEEGVPPTESVIPATAEDREAAPEVEPAGEGPGPTEA